MTVGRATIRAAVDFGLDRFVARLDELTLKILQRPDPLK